MEVALHLLIDEEMKLELGRRAETCKMSLSNYVRNVFAHHIETQAGFTVTVSPT